MRRELLRIIDANFNRSREGLRVCEDIARFALNSKKLSGQLKTVRHGISDILKADVAIAAELYASRDSQKDVGRASKTPGELRKDDLADIFTANMERVKESLRVLEEVFKLIDKSSSIRFARLRFEAYNVEKKAVGKICSLRNSRQGNLR